MHESTNQLADEMPHDNTEPVDMNIVDEPVEESELFLPLTDEQRSQDEEELLYEGDDVEPPEEAVNEKIEENEELDNSLSVEAADDNQDTSAMDDNEPVDAEKDDIEAPEAEKDDTEAMETAKDDAGAKEADIVQLHDMSSTEIEFDKKQNTTARYESTSVAMDTAWGGAFSTGSRLRVCARLC